MQSPQAEQATSDLAPAPTSNGPVARESGKYGFYYRTWTGRLILINALVFFLLSLKSHSVFMPDYESLLVFGAKDSWSLAHGQYWRFFTPIFVHIGILHFAVNSYMLYVIGQQIERDIGGWYFLALYLAAGVAGNVASAVFSLNLSAGASGALFGLLGCGFVLERTVGRMMRQETGKKTSHRAYAMTILINLAFGLVVPFIDNAAHIGGLVTGILLSYAMINLRPNRLQRVRRVPGGLALMVWVSALCVGVFLGSSREYLKSRLMDAGYKEGSSLMDD